MKNNSWLRFSVGCLGFIILLLSFFGGCWFGKLHPETAWKEIFLLILGTGVLSMLVWVLGYFSKFRKPQEEEDHSTEEQS